VTSIVRDDEGLGRIELKFPWLGDDGDEVRALATMCTPYADDDQGWEFIPAVDTQVLVAFEAGSLRRPYVLGACWNGLEKLPQRPQEANNKRLIKTRAGSLLEFDDKEGAAKVTVSMKGGHKLVMDEGGQKITLSHQNGSSITLSSSGDIEIKANARVVVTAASVMVNAASSTFSGSITCTALTATSITSPVYSPGAGNVW
jgi:uncharacterized protein involved in type VI secretion and phage assembly